MSTLLITNVFPPKAGGSGRWFWELYRRLPREEYVVAAGRWPGSVEFDQSHDVQIQRIPLQFRTWGLCGVRPIFDYVTAWRRLRAMQITFAVQYVHAGCALPEGYLAWLFKRYRRLPYAVFVHGEELQVFRSSRELTWMANRVFRDANLIIANCRNTANLLAEWPVTSGRVEVMYPGVDTKKFVPSPPSLEARNELGWGQRPTILTVGRLQRRKGHENLIRALPQVRVRIPNVLYAIIGDGADRSRLEQLVNTLGLSDHVRFYGTIDDDVIRRAYQQCDLFALPNHEVNGDFEGFGIVLLEAQACGKPVIAGASGGTKEAVDSGKTGLIMDCEIHCDLARIISELLLDAQRRDELGRQARQWTTERFDWQCLSKRAQFLFASATKVAKARAANPAD